MNRRMNWMERDGIGTIPAMLRTWGKVRDLFVIDDRSLALFRGCLGAILFVDLILRGRDLHAFYTDAGVLPRLTLLATNSPSWNLCFHLASGSFWFQLSLFTIAALAALCILFNFKTRLMLFISWVLLLSLHNRNPLILNGGDVYLRCLLFWSLFIAFSPKEAARHGVWRDLGNAGLLLQTALIYATSGLAKFYTPEWRNGSALLHLFAYSSIPNLYSTHHGSRGSCMGQPMAWSG